MVERERDVEATFNFNEETFEFTTTLIKWWIAGNFFLLLVVLLSVACSDANCSPRSQSFPLNPLEVLRPPESHNVVVHAPCPSCVCDLLISPEKLNSSSVGEERGITAREDLRGRTFLEDWDLDKIRQALRGREGEKTTE